MFAGKAYQSEYDHRYIEDLLGNLSHSCVVLTGVGYETGSTGIVVSENGRLHYYSHKRIGRNFHGTGDMFAACFTGAWMQEKSMAEAVKIAADFTLRCIQNTYEAPAHWYGVKFETALPDLMKMLFE